MKTVNKLEYIYKKLKYNTEKQVDDQIDISDEEYATFYEEEIEDDEEEEETETIVPIKTRARQSRFNVGDIMVYDKVNNKLKFRTYENYDNTDSNLEPIAVCAVPDYMISDNCARWIYIHNLKQDGKELFYWDSTITTNNNGEYVSEHGYVKPEHQNHIDMAASYPLINESDSHEVATNEVVRWDNIGVISVDNNLVKGFKFVEAEETDIESPTDPGCHYIVSYASNSNTHVNMVLSPYRKVNNEYTINYYHSQSNGSDVPSENAFINRQGIRNTYLMATCEYAQDYEAAYAVQNMKTPLLASLTNEHGGAWFIGSPIEYACMLSRINMINASLVKCGGTPIAYNTYSNSGSQPASTDNGELLYDKYWTSMEASENYANMFSGFWYNENTGNKKIGGQVGTGFKFWQLLVRPMTMTYFYQKYSEMDSVVLRWDEESESYKFLIMTDIYDISDMDK